MKTKLTSVILMALLLLNLLSGCGNATNDSDGSPSAAETAPSAGVSAPGDDVPSDNNGQVAGKDDMAPAVDLNTEGLTPVYGSDLKDGVYEIDVDSSSSMFKIVACTLSVKNGEMTATMTMGGTGYLYVYMGTGEEAVNAGEDSYIPFVEDESGAHTYTVPVEALNSGIDCAAFSKNKEMWYDRTLVFRADSLPMDAFADGMIATAESLGLEDGSYTVEVTLSGGSGRASVESPAQLTVENGAATAVIVWSSSNYDYMKVNGVQYDLINTEGNSAFVIPVLGFDFQMPVLADTTAMSTPHEVEYTLYFDSTTIQAQS